MSIHVGALRCWCLYETGTPSSVSLSGVNKPRCTLDCTWHGQNCARYRTAGTARAWAPHGLHPCVTFTKTSRGPVVYCRLLISTVRVDRQHVLARAFTKITVFDTRRVVLEVKTFLSIDNVASYSSAKWCRSWSAAKQSSCHVMLTRNPLWFF